MLQDFAIWGLHLKKISEENIAIGGVLLYIRKWNSVYQEMEPGSVFEIGGFMNKKGIGVKTGWRKPLKTEKFFLDGYFKNETGKTKHMFFLSGMMFSFLGLVFLVEGIKRQEISQIMFCWIIAALFFCICLCLLKSGAKYQRIMKNGLQGNYLMQYCLPIWSQPFSRNPNRGYVRVKTEDGEFCDTIWEIDGATERKFRKEKYQERMIMLTMPDESWTKVVTRRQMNLTGTNTLR